MNWLKTWKPCDQPGENEVPSYAEPPRGNEITIWEAKNLQSLRRVRGWNQGLQGCWPDHGWGWRLVYPDREYKGVRGTWWWRGKQQQPHPMRPVARLDGQGHHHSFPRHRECQAGSPVPGLADKAPTEAGAENKTIFVPRCHEVFFWLSFLIFSILWIYLGSGPIYCKLWF